MDDGMSGFSRELNLVAIWSTSGCGQCCRPPAADYKPMSNRAYQMSLVLTDYEVNSLTK